MFFIKVLWGQKNYTIIIEKGFKILIQAMTQFMATYSLLKV